MARKKSSFLDDLLNIFTFLPWWVGLLAAIMSYYFLHRYAISEAAVLSEANRQIESITGQIARQFARVFQYIIPLICMLGAALSFFHTKRKKVMFDRQTSLESIKKLSWKEFEELVGEYYRRNGYSVAETESGPDGGVDLVLNKNGEKTLVQCKQWKKSKVGVSTIREVFGVVKANNADHAVVVSTGEFTQEAENFANQNNVELISGNHLLSLIGSVKKKEGKDEVHDESPDMVYCPKCNDKMILRTAGKGVNMGKKFWGCSRFPKCRGTRNI